MNDLRLLSCGIVRIGTKGKRSMQLFIKIRLQEPLVLPLSYHHIVQAAIYELVSSGDEEMGRLLHDEGASYEKRKYKLFCFSSLHGRSRVRNKRIAFSEYMYFEVRSVNEDFIRVLNSEIRKKGIRFGEKRYPVEYTKVRQRQIHQNRIQVRMLSPVTVRVTDPRSGESRSVAPWEDRFPGFINANFQRKYESWYGVPPEESVGISWTAIDRKKDEYVTRYKGHYVCGWRGTYELTGSPEALTFLYDTGIGSRNSQGFGMIELEGDSE